MCAYGYVLQYPYVYYTYFGGEETGYAVILAKIFLVILGQFGCVFQFRGTNAIPSICVYAFSFVPCTIDLNLCCGLYNVSMKVNLRMFDFIQFVTVIVIYLHVKNVEIVSM